MRRGMFVAAFAAAVLVLAGTPASAGEADCGAFARTQTYVGWGPAAYYDRTVTVVFSADGCDAGLAEDAFSFDLTGTAVVYEGSGVSGEPLDVQPFVTSGVFTDPGGSGWPPSWWSCETDAARIEWSIPGVYSFVATATAGAWTLDVQVPGADPVHWTHAGC